MSRVNISCEALSSNKNITVQRGPPGIGFKYLDGAGNFDIGKKRLANVAKPEESFDAVKHDIYDMHDIYIYIYI